MTQQNLPTILEGFLLRDLATVAEEIGAYSDEAQIWRDLPGLPNSGGTLALHLAGNLQHNVGALLGSTGYERDREWEFSARGLPRQRVLEELQNAAASIRHTFSKFDPETLEQPFPERIRNAQISTAEALVQLTVHLAYHLGQISYHRRLVTGNAEGVGALDSGKLKSARTAWESGS